MEESDEQGYRSKPIVKKDTVIKQNSKFNLQYAKHFWKDGFRGNFNTNLYEAVMRVKYDQNCYICN